MSIEYLIGVNLVIVEAIKLALGSRLDHKFLPLIGIVTGVILAYFFGFKDSQNIALLIVGLASSGLFKLVQPVGDVVVERTKDLLPG